MLLNDQHISISSAVHLQEICQPLFTHTDISYFEYFRLFKDGSRAWLATDAARTKHMFETDVKETTKFSDNIPILNNRCYLWSSLLDLMPKQPQLLLANKLAISKNDFKIDNGICFVEHTEHYQEYFSFATKPGAVGIIDFYLNNTGFLEIFILYFKDKAKDIIDAAVKNRIIMLPNSTDSNTELPQEVTPLEKYKHGIEININRYYFTLNNKQTYFTKQEFECVKLLAKGASIKQIANYLTISPRTVEYYLKSARLRTHTLTNNELIKLFWASSLAKLS